jgi:hypothetical protein
MRIWSVAGWGLVVSAVAAGPAAADCYKVGPGGTHATLQPAVNAALAAGGLDCIRVAAGYRAERLNLPDLLAGRTLTISGGWDGAFAVQTGTTTLDGAGLAPVVHVFTRSGILSLSRFRVVNGNTSTLGTPTGGGLRLTLQGTAAVQIDDCEVLNNRLSGENGAGGGLWADVGGTAVLGIVRTRFAGNAVHAPTGQAFGGGAHILASDDSRLVVAESHFLNNEVSGSEYTEAAALDIFVGKNARADVTDNTALGNRTLSTSGDAWGTVHLQAGRVDSADTAQIVARRNRIQQNVVQRTDGHQLELRTTGATTLWVTDTLVSNSSGTGILAWANGGTMYLTNLTVTRQGADGLRVIGGAETVFLTSSILSGNGTDLDGAAQLRSNLIGVDPLFLDPATRDYHLAPGSPAIDAGASSTPGDLGPLDLDRLARVQGWRVDQGAYETSAGPGGGGGGPECRVRELEIPAPRFSGVCRCLTDDSLREFHCGFFTPDLFVAIRFPFVDPIGQPLPVEWTIDPWTTLGSGPYDMRSEARIGGQWKSQTWLGPSAPGLKRGQPVVERFLVEVPPGTRTPLRATLSYPRRTGQPRGRIEVDVVLPEFKAQ